MEMTAIFTKLNSWRIYKVTYVNLKTNCVDSVIVEAPDSATAGDSIVSALGEEYDLLKSIAVKPTELN
jgi:hypothetical protein